MKEWKNGSMEDLKKSLTDFVRRYKSSGYKKKKLLEDLEYVIHQMYSVSGPVYDRVGGTTNVKPDRIMILLDKKDRIERAIRRIDEDKKLLDSFVVSLTERQREVFDWCFMKNEKIIRIARYLSLSSTRISQIIELIVVEWWHFNKQYKKVS